MKKITSIAVRLALRFSLLLTVAILAMVVAFSISQSFVVRSQQKTELENASDFIITTLEQYKPEELENAFPQLPYYITYVVYEADTDITYSTNDPYLPFLGDTNGKALRYFDADYFIDGALNILYFGQTVELENQTVVIVTALNMDTDTTVKMLAQLPKLAVVAFIPVLILSFLVALFITKRTMQPVVKITATAKEISSTSLDTLLPVKHNSLSYDEIDNLALTFNDLFKRLKDDFDREKQFTSDVSHELKTPVAVILGQANLLRRWGKDDPAQLEKSLGTIIAETKSMEAIISNLLQMSRIESGKIQPQMENVNLNELLHRLKDETLIIKPDCEFEIDCEKENCTVSADIELLHQVMTVITSNSIKFCTAADINPIRLIAKVKQKDDKSIISISDNGLGFSEESLPHVFERFYRGDPAHTRSAGGSGLGLSIAQTIIESMEGTIHAENAENGGARIVISLKQ